MCFKTIEFVDSPVISLVRLEGSWSEGFYSRGAFCRAACTGIDVVKIIAEVDIMEY